MIIQNFLSCRVRGIVIMCRVTIETALCQLFQMILCGRRMCIAGIIVSCKLVVLVAQIAAYEGIHSENSKLSYCKPICGFPLGLVSRTSQKCVPGKMPGSCGNQFVALCHCRPSSILRENATIVAR